MKRVVAILAIFVLAPCPLYADYTVEDHGSWPANWPEELEPLRKSARTLEGPSRPLLQYAIPFTKREEFESAWPHLLKVKSKGAPIVLTRGPSFWLGKEQNAGVCVHTPPEGQAPIADGKDANGNWEKTIYIELIVDSEVIDLNRIPLPPDTPILDKRFKEGPAPQAQHKPVELPLVPADIRPINGCIVEYWPNGKLRSERVYVSGRVQEAVYCASDGTVTFEMSEDSPTAVPAGK
jgi:hypothetical protein